MKKLLSFLLVLAIISSMLYGCNCNEFDDDDGNNSKKRPSKTEAGELIKPEQTKPNNTDSNDDVLDNESENSESSVTTNAPNDSGTEPEEDIEINYPESAGLEYFGYGDGTCYVNGIGTCRDEVLVIPAVSPYGEIVTGIGNDALSELLFVKNIILPETLIAIGAYAFEDCKNLQTIKFSTGLKTISWEAFQGCTSLEEVVIPDGVIEIGDKVFANCSNLKKVDFPDSLVELGVETFSGCSNDLFEFEGGIYYIDNWAIAYDKSTASVSLRQNTVGMANSLFRDASKLEAVVIPSSLTRISYRAFNNCNALTKVTVHDDLISIASKAFEGCNNDLFESENGVNYIGKWVVGTNDNIETITLRNGTIGIAQRAFFQSSLKAVIIPDGVKYIDEEAFYLASCLESVTIPASTTEIGQYAFIQCVNLVNIIVDEKNPIYSSKDNSSLIHTETKTLLVASANGYIPTDGSVIKIGPYLFYHNTRIKSIVIPDSITVIEAGAFRYCEYLTEITIPSSVKTIGNYAFEKCKNLNTVNYSGTKEEWSRIHKSSFWDQGTYNYTVYCSDGIISGLDA